MYKKSILTFAIYKDEVKINEDYRDTDFVEYQKWCSKGNEAEFFNGTNEEIEFHTANILQGKKDALKAEYKTAIHELINVHVQKNVMRGVPIPEEIMEQYNNLRAEYNQKLMEL